MEPRPARGSAFGVVRPPIVRPRSDVTRSGSSDDSSTPRRASGDEGSRSNGAGSPRSRRRARTIVRSPNLRLRASAACIARCRRSSSLENSPSWSGSSRWIPVTPRRRILFPRISGRARRRAAWKIGSARSVGSASGACRVTVRNPESRTLTTTVPGASAHPAQPPGDAVRQAEERPLELLRVARVAVERVLVPDRLHRLRLVDRVAIDPVGAVDELDPVLPEAPLERVGGHAGEVADRPDAQLGEGGRGRRADAPQPRDGSGARNAASSPARDDDQAVRLAQVRPDLGDELGGPDADARGEPGLRVDRRLDPPRDLLRTTRTAPRSRRRRGTPRRWRPARPAT